MKIPVIKVFKESFDHILKNMLSWVRLAFAPFVVLALGSLLQILIYAASGNMTHFDLAFFDQITDPKLIDQNNFITLANFIPFISMCIMQYCIVINFYRYAVLDERGNDWWTLPLNRCFLKMVLYTFFFGILTWIYMLFSAGVFFIIQNFFENSAIDMITFILLAIFAYYLLCRIFLSFLLISIDDSEPIKTSWRLMKGNILRFTVLVVLIIFSLLLILSLLGLISLGIELFFIPNINIDLIKNLFLFSFRLFGLFLILFSLAFFCKALALVRQSLTEELR
jgi:hypothetical protein